MRAPTNVYGPDGTLCRAGEEIPADWHKAMPDLKDHLRVAPSAEAATVAEQVSMTGVSTTRTRRGTAS